MKEKKEDVLVVERVLGGDTHSFEILLRKYQDTVAGIVAPKVPWQNMPEVTQDVFVRAYKSLSGYRGKEPFGHWLKTIAVRACHDFWRVRYRNRETPVSALSESTKDWLEYSQVDGNTVFSGNDIRNREGRP